MIVLFYSLLPLFEVTKWLLTCYGLFEVLFLFLDICPDASEHTALLRKHSQIGDFTEPVPELFKVLTEFPDEANKWSAETFPINISECW